MPGELRILSYNIRYGGVGRERPIAAVVDACGPDLVVLQEATRPDVVARVAEATGMRAWAAVRGRSLAFMSRSPVQSWAWHRPWRSRRAFLEIELGDGRGRIFGVHLSAVHSNWTERRRVRELRAILKHVSPFTSQLHVVVGDFNTLAPGEDLDIARLPARLRTIAWLTGGRIRWQTIQLMLEAGYIDGYRVRHASERGFTFPAASPHVRLDYAFVPGPFARQLNACDVMVSAPQTSSASDHLPLLTKVLIN